MMKDPGWIICCVALASMAVATGILADEPASPAASSEDAIPSDVIPRVSVREARRQAEILHTALHSTVQLVHHHYYREDEGLRLPASVMKEIFAEIERDEHVQLRWLAVDGVAMNTDHEPQTDFERKAVALLKQGQSAIEEVDGDVYRRAGPIRLSSHCLKCHVPDRKRPTIAPPG
ncbi:MAG: DUF3365 domain-containing protein [Planctomycetaceae bacterium]|nr:DUF3365 domain-containing protein [Planctomycetaceae bacterium]